MRKCTNIFTIYEEAVSSIWMTLHPIPLNCLINEENFIFFFIALSDDALFLLIITDLSLYGMHCKDKINIPRKGISGSQSQVPHSCVCERFIYSNDRPAFSTGGNM
jgi:hypothetical protein